MFIDFLSMLSSHDSRLGSDSMYDCMLNLTFQMNVLLPSKLYVLFNNVVSE